MPRSDWAVPPGTIPDAGLLLVAWCAVAVAIAERNGAYWTGGLVAVVGALILGFLAVGTRLRVPLRVALVPVVLVVLSGAFWSGPSHVSSDTFSTSRGLAVLAAVLVVGTLRWPRLFWTAVAVLAAAAAVRVAAVPNPPIDVHYLLTNSTRGLLHGRNLYDQSWPGSPPHELQNEYPYLPWSSVLLLPSWLLTSEVRYGLVAALVVAVWAMRPARPTRPVRVQHGVAVAAFLPLLLMAYPKLGYQIQESWTEPLLVMLLALMVLAVQRGRPALGVVALALALACKQHIVLLLPLAALWPAFGWRRTIAAALGGFLLVVPWLAADPSAMWHDAVLLNIHYPVLRNGLDVPAALARADITLGFAATGVVVLAAYAVCALRASRDAAGFAAGCGLVQLALDVFNKQSFFNHYTLPMGLFVIGAVVATESSPREILADRDVDRSAA